MEKLLDHLVRISTEPLHRVLSLEDMARLDKNQKWSGRQKYSARLITLSHVGILTTELLYVNRGTLQMRIAISRE